MLTKVPELTQRAKPECCTTKKEADARLASDVHSESGERCMRRKTGQEEVKSSLIRISCYVCTVIATMLESLAHDSEMQIYIERVKGP